MQRCRSCKWYIPLRLHLICNLLHHALTLSVILHGLRNFDSHIICQCLGKYAGNIVHTSNFKKVNMFKFWWFTIHLCFPDLSASLESLVEKKVNKWTGIDIVKSTSTPPPPRPLPPPLPPHTTTTTTTTRQIQLNNHKMNSRKTELVTLFPKRWQLCYQT